MFGYGGACLPALFARAIIALDAHITAAGIEGHRKGPRFSVFDRQDGAAHRQADVAL
jgi:hypothetical protein